MQNPPARSYWQPSESFWKSLQYFNLYRFCIAVILFVSSQVNTLSISVLSDERSTSHLVVTGFYLLATFASVVILRFFRRRFNLQLSTQVLIDILVLTALIHFEGGLRGGFGAMLLVSLAGAGLVGQGRLVLLYAAMATLAVLLEQTYRSVSLEAEVVDFFQAGLFCAGFFGVAISARLLARRVVANEELAHQRGVELNNQTLVSQRIIEEMQDGVLVLTRDGGIRQHNPRASQLLGLGDPSERKLANYSTELARGFSSWCEYATDAPMMIRAPASGMQLRVRFVTTDSSDKNVLVFLEDMGRLQDQARQIKLAALGRLTANIAHEIRNPLSAINHAGELLREESRDPTSDRLLRIVLENVQRVERIVSDVLELGRRDRAHRELIDLRQTLPALVDEYTSKEGVAAGVVQIEFSGQACLHFDRSHLHQVMWNLIGNALRHSQKKQGSIHLSVADGSMPGWVQIHVVDDGSGVDPRFHEQVFEPFFTTHSRGTGLGLYIARELCEANGARLELVSNERGADFCISGRFNE